VYASGVVESSRVPKTYRKKEGMDGRTQTSLKDDVQPSGGMRERPFGGRVLSKLLDWRLLNVLLRRQSTSKKGERRKTQRATELLQAESFRKRLCREKKRRGKRAQIISLRVGNFESRRARSRSRKKEVKKAEARTEAREAGDPLSKSPLNMLKRSKNSLLQS